MERLSTERGPRRFDALKAALARGGQPRAAVPTFVAGLAVVDFPVAFGMESHLKEAVLGIVALAAGGAGHVAAPGGAFAVVIFGDRECGAATAGD